MKDLLNEMDRMKNLFEHKRGVVISEQDPFSPKYEGQLEGGINILKGSKFECMMSANALQNAKFTFGDSDKNELTVKQKNIHWSFTSDGRFYDVIVNFKGTWKCNLPPDIPGFKIFWPDKNKFYDSTTNSWKDDLSKVKVDPRVKPNVDPNTKQNKGGKTIFDIVQSEKNPATGKNYVWKEVRRAYQVEKQPSTPEGNVKTNLQLQKDWMAGWRPGQEKKLTPDNKPAEKLPYTSSTLNQTNKQAGPGFSDEDEDASPTKAKVTLPAQVANYVGQQQAFANTDPNEYYKSLYNSGLIQGEGGNRVRYKGPELDKSQQDKLTQAMTNLGYEFYRKGNDNRLVYRKK